MKRIPGEWFVFTAKGHPNVRATHRTTLEITKEETLTPRGDCIIAVGSEAALSDLPESIKRSIRGGGLVVMVICAGGYCDSVVGWGHPDLSLEDPVRIIARRSTYTDHKTLMIRASKAARDLDRRLVEALRRGKTATVAIGTLGKELFREGLDDLAGNA
ncbi:MAG: DUF371 domain-containing protein [Desulfurococcales archaeon]|nr:DUF371 domain-containing protein [Desulfurococcales archaeon]